MERARWMDYFFLKTLVWETEGSPQENHSAVIFSGSNTTRKWGLNKLYLRIWILYFEFNPLSCYLVCYVFVCEVVNMLLNKMLFIYLNILKITVVFNQYCKEFSLILHYLILLSLPYAKDFIFFHTPDLLP